MKPRLIFLILFYQAICVLSSTPSAADTSRKAPVKPGSAQAAKPADKEIMLGEIEIQGALEKPSVIIVPKRIEPELKEKELSRSFEQEVKQSAGEIPKQDESLRKVEPAPSIKKTIEKKRD
jgi:hypothetical protein